MPMLQKFFRANDVVLASILEQRVSEDTITIAMTENLITSENSPNGKIYRILPRGKDYLYN